MGTIWQRYTRVQVIKKIRFTSKYTGKKITGREKYMFGDYETTIPQENFAGESILITQSFQYIFEISKSTGFRT